MKFIVYTDGGCQGNKRDFGCPGGYGFVILDSCDSIMLQGGSLCENTTNNRMEMMAAIKGLAHLKNILDNEYDKSKKHDCLVRTDSKYICNNFEEYLPEWKKNGWKKSKGGSVLNKDLWMEIDKLTPEFKSLRFQWVKGHAEDKWNLLADSIARGRQSRFRP